MSALFPGLVSGVPSSQVEDKVSPLCLWTSARGGPRSVRPLYLLQGRSLERPVGGVLPWEGGGHNSLSPGPASGSSLGRDTALQPSCSQSAQHQDSPEAQRWGLGLAGRLDGGSSPGKLCERIYSSGARSRSSS